MSAVRSPQWVRSAVPFVLAAILLTAPRVATAAVRYAEPGGDGPEPCLASNPCSVEVAVESVSVTDGDEVVIRPGDYDLGVNNLEITDDIELHGEDGQPRPRINSTATIGVLTNGTGAALIRDLEIVHSGGGSAGLLFAVPVERVEVTSDGHAACIPFYTARIRDSICRGTGATSAGLRLSAGGGMPTVDVPAVNLTAVGTVYGIEVSTQNGPNYQINATNVIAQGGTADIHVDTDAVMGADADVVLDHSSFQTELEDGDAAAAITDPGSGTNQIAEPLFRDAAAGDFHQLAGSPTRNEGTTDPDLGALDIDREPRIQESAPDIGADEFDLRRPETVISKGPRRRVRTPKRRVRAKVQFSADELGVSFECKLDRGPFRPCVSPFRRKVRARRGRGASHVFRVRATDPWGNLDLTPAVRRWRAIRI